MILSVTRLKFPKSPEILLNAIKTLVSQHPNLQCLIAGDGPDRDMLTHLIKTLNLESHVRILGPIENIQELLSIADIFVLSSHSEGLSISVLEAMAAGLPIVASDVGGMQELIDHNHTGFLVPPGDAGALSECLNEMLTDSKKRSDFRIAAQARLTEKFNLQKQIQETTEFFLDEITRVRTTPLSFYG